MAFYKYTKYVIPGPNGYSLSFKNVETDKTGNIENNGEEVIRAEEVGELNGERYVYVPDSIVATFPVQDPKIKWQGVEMTEELRAKLKEVSPQCELISQEMIKKIREKYSSEEESYFARIGIGVCLGVYEFEEGEREELLAFGRYVEEVRSWGREQRAKIGL